jgi:hypothetical protein
MISELASPAVCVVDDEREDYQPILAALNGLYVSSIHILGTLESLPSQPFNRLRLVFLDLHLTGAIGKNATSYTANVFRKVVSVDTAPVIVVIWSKYASDKVDTADVPPEDQETEAQLFKRTLLEAEPNYVGRLIFVEMDKPKKDARPEDWTDRLKLEINNSLQGQSAVELLWAWDGLVKDGCAKISQDMTSVAQAATAGTSRELKDGLKATMQHLSKAQSAGDFSSATAPKHLLSALTQLLVDQLEHPMGIASIAPHGAWLSEAQPGAVSAEFPGKMNGFLLTSDNSAGAGLYAPGTVFRITDPAKFPTVFGKQVSDLLAICFRRSAISPKWQDWQRDARPVLIELSPICDLAQGYRVNSLLVGGVIVPASYKDFAKMDGDAFGGLAKFHLRWPSDGFLAQDVLLLYCHRYKTTLPVGQHADWLAPWFRLRDLPLAAIRNSNAAHGARVGYVSLI